MALTGHCMCGAVTYRCDADPIFTAVCHCTDCQHQTGTAASIVVGVPAAALSVSGDTLRRFTTMSDDSGPTHREFCSACGSPIVSRKDAAPDVVYLKAGTLDDTSTLAPTLEVWGRSAQPWVATAPGATRLERGPS
ncbi:MAG: GFA family protein [Thermoleophilia bacterium]